MKLTTQRSHRSKASAFTLMELLVVIAIIGILAGLLLPALASARSLAAKTVCLNNLNQVSLSVRLYTDDFNGMLPLPSGDGWSYKDLTMRYTGLTGLASQQGKLFACPKDNYYLRNVGGGQMAWIGQGLHEQAATLYSSYWFNGLNLPGNDVPGLAGKNLATVASPVKTVLLAEAGAFGGYSWHHPRRDFQANLHGVGLLRVQFNDTRSMVSFADGHISYVKIYWNGSPGEGGLPFNYDPIPGYDYKWSSD